MTGPFKLKYFFFGNGKEDIYKSLGHGIRFIIIIALAILFVFGGLQIWNFLFPKRPVNENKPTINVGQGGVSNYTVVQKSDSGWDTGVFAGGLTLGGENGGFVGIEVKKRW